MTNNDKKWAALVQILICVIALLSIFPHGYMFAAGDTIQYVNFPRMISELNHVWSSFPGEGGYLTVYPYNIFYYPLYFLKLILGLNASILSFFYFFLFLSTSFWCFYLSLNFYQTDIKQKYKTILAFAYAFNIYTFYAFYSGWGFNILLWLYPFIPLIFGLVYRYFIPSGSGQKINFKLLSIIGIVLFFSGVANGNLAFFISLNLLLFLFIILLFLFYRKKHFLSLWIFIKKAIFLYIVYFLVAFWSVVPQLPGILGILNFLRSEQSLRNLENWLMWQSARFPNPFFVNFDIIDIASKSSLFYFSILFPLAALLAVVYSKKITRLGIIFFTILLVDIFLLNKGNGIIGKDFIWVMFNNPILSSIRSTDKTMIFLPFLFLIIAFVNFKKISEKKIIIVTFLFLFSAIVTCLPLLSGKIQTNSSSVLKPGENYLTAKQTYIVKIPQEYFDAGTMFNFKKEDSKIFSIPYNVQNSIGWSNYPMWKMIGADPTLQLFPQSVVQMVSPSSFGTWNYGELWNTQSNDESLWIMPFSGFLNTSYFIYHKDVDERFIKQTQDKIIFYKNNKLINKVYSNDYFDVYKISNKYYIPHFYTPQTLITISQNIDTLPEIVSQKDYKIRSAIYFNNINKENTNNKEETKFNPNELKKETVKNTPILEFKKINSTKYKIRVHGAKDDFPLVFSESFHNGWKAYLAKSYKVNKVESASMANYRILDGNEEDQANKEELQNYIDKGWVTDLGDGKGKTITNNKWKDGKEKLDYVEKYNIDFVSKNFQGTIQNDNLPNGSIFETWFKEPLSDENHLTANGYANSWLIDVNEVCKVEGGKLKSSCVKNPDGSYDFNMVVEFWPQRLFYIGLFISGLTLLSCLGYLGYDWRKRKKKRQESVTAL